jgi:hypothetical protein
MAPRDAFPGYDEPVNIDLEPEEALKILLTADPTQVLDQVDEDVED